MLTNQDLQEVARHYATARRCLGSPAAQHLAQVLTDADSWTKDQVGLWLAGYLDLPAALGEKVEANEVLAAMARFLERSRE